MQKKYILQVLFLLGLSVFSFAQNDVEWEHFIGDEGKDKLNSISEDKKGNLIVITSTVVQDEVPHHDIIITKMNRQGDLLWEKNYGSSADELGVDLTVTENNEIVVLMTVSDAVNLPAKSQDIQIVKFSQYGKPIWKSSFGGTGIDRGASIINGHNNDFWISGSVMSKDFGFESNAGSVDQWIANIDSDGQLIKSQLFGGSDEDFAQKIELLPDGRILLLGHSSSTDFAGNYGDFDITLSEISSDLSLNWVQSYGGESLDFASDILVENDTYFIVGKTASQMNDISSNEGFYDAWIFKTNNAGQLLSEKSWGGGNSEIVAGIERLENGNLAIVGTTNSNSFLGETIENYAVFSIEFTQKIQLVQSEVSHQEDYIEIQDFIVDQKGDFFVGGSSKKPSRNSNGWIYSSRREANNAFSFKVHPNPSAGELYLNDLQSGDEVMIFDISGGQKATFKQEEGTSHQLDLSHLNSGVYFIHLYRNGEKCTVRWVKN